MRSFRLQRLSRALVATRTRRAASSFVRGSTEEPLLEQTFPEYFAQNLLPKYSANTALISTHEHPRAHGGPSLVSRSDAPYLTWTFEDLDRHVAALARGLLKLGVGKGDRVGVVMGNSSAYAVLQWACARIGVVLVTINPAYKMSEMLGAMNLTGVSILFITPRLRSSNYISLLSEALPASTRQDSVIRDPALPTLRTVVLMDNLTHGRHGELVNFADERAKLPASLDYREVLVWREDDSTKAEVDRISASLDNNEIINLQFTSGTTGAPKAVSLTHRNLLNNARHIGKCMSLTSKDVVFVYPAEVFDARATLHTLEAMKCTTAHGVPTHFLGLLSEVDRVHREEHRNPDLSSLRTGIAAGSTVPIDLMRQLIGKLNLTELTIAYGMTETSPVSFQTIPSDPMAKRTETVGRVQPHVVAKIVDPKGNIVDVGTPGELCVSGYLAHKGYWNDPEHSASIMKKEIDPDGKTQRDWIYTGDEAIIDEDGYLRIVGRLKDLIIRGGENLFPVQIENVLTDHPQIREAAAVAVPDAKFGEVVGVWIVREDAAATDDLPNTDADKNNISGSEVRAWVASRMNPQNAPAHVWFLNEGEIREKGYLELPKTGSGKVQKNILRDWSRALAKDGMGAL